jgi:hypothetical protein
VLLLVGVFMDHSFINILIHNFWCQIAHFPINENYIPYISELIFWLPSQGNAPPCDSCLSHVSCVLKLYAGETDGKDPPLLAFKHYLRNIEFCSNSDIVKNKPHILLFFFFNMVSCWVWGNFGSLIDIC